MRDIMQSATESKVVLLIKEDFPRRQQAICRLKIKVRRHSNLLSSKKTTSNLPYSPPWWAENYRKREGRRIVCLSKVKQENRNRPLRAFPN